MKPASLKLLSTLVLITPLLFPADRILLDLGSEKVLKEATAKEISGTVEGGALRFTPMAGFTYAWPGYVFQFPPADLSDGGELALEVANVGTVSAEVGIKVGTVSAAGKKAQDEKRFQIVPGVTMTLKFPITPKGLAADRPVLFLMNGVPPWAQNPGSKASELDWSRVTELGLHFVRPSAQARLVLKPLVVRGPSAGGAKAPEKPFPLFDTFGQYLHGDWPGKIHTVADLTGGAAAERAEYDAKPRPKDWDKYGGWAKGPALMSTGFFYVTNLAGKWWYVDPEGKLFFAHGIHGVRYGTPTPVTDRESWFEKLPDPSDPVLGSFWESYKAWGSWYYKEGTPVRTYNFTQANLRRKYGEDWKKTFDDLCTRRLPSWGMNTIGAGSSLSIPALKRMAYYVYVVPKAPVLKAAKGYWGNFYDVFDPGFAPAVKAALGNLAKTLAEDPWLLGVGVDNELSWGAQGAASLAVATLQCPPDQAGKRAFVEELRKKYGEIEALNRAWGAAHASWEALLASTAAPDAKKAGEDLRAFNEKLIARYFQVCRDSVREQFPRHLYTGCRFASRAPEVEAIAHRYCDVVSHNHYKYDVGELVPPVANPRPLMVTEFHFCVPDRGHFSPAGLLEVPHLAAQAERYGNYLSSALAHPLVVGTFWFLYQHEPPSGRFDGENYSCGFVDSVDVPVRELVEASRKVGEHLYSRRNGK
ncbi:MAG: beta-galactosidase [Spirochaetes bacterium]|nr:beta-galactosidase [Spirochaetota bacterium]